MAVPVLEDFRLNASDRRVRLPGHIAQPNKVKHQPSFTRIERFGNDAICVSQGKRIKCLVTSRQVNERISSE